MDKEILNIYLYGGPTLVSKKLLAKWPIEVQMSTHRGGVIWKAIRKYALDYSPRSNVILTALKVSVPKGVVPFLSKRLDVSASMPLHLHKGNTVTVMIKRWHKSVIVS